MPIYSMTGYGAATCKLGKKSISLQLISLNSRNFDFHYEIPPGLKSRIIPWRKLLQDRLHRGRTTLTITSQAELGESLMANRQVIERYFYDLKNLSTKLASETDLLGWALQLFMQDNAKEEKDEFFEKDLLVMLDQALEEAITQCIESRAREGKQLANHVQACMAQLFSQIKEIQDHLPARKALLQERLLERQKTCKNENKEASSWERDFMQYNDKISLEEEVVRLQSHIDYLATTLSKGYPIGKGIGFIVQEMGREVNTIGAKAQDARLQHLAVQAKEVLEQLKEQSQNML